MIVDVFLDHIRYLTIVHHVKGRIRVKAGWDALPRLGNVDTKEIEKIMDRIPGIRGYRVNKRALSVVIEYDPEILSYSLWEDVGALRKYPAHRQDVKTQLLDILQREKES